MERRIRFGPFELDKQTGELWKNGAKVRLQGKPFQVLVALLERPGEPVSREELQQRLWSGDTFVDFESGLNTAANRLRLTLGDSADSPRYVETLARSGYRFVAKVEEIAQPAPAKPPVKPTTNWWIPIASAGSDRVGRNRLVGGAKSHPPSRRSSSKSLTGEGRSRAPASRLTARTFFIAPRWKSSPGLFIWPVR